MLREANSPPPMPVHSATRLLSLPSAGAVYCRPPRAAEDNVPCIRTYVEEAVPPADLRFKETMTSLFDLLRQTTFVGKR